MAETQNADSGSVVEEDYDNAQSLGTEKIGTKCPRKTQEQVVADQIF